MRPDDHFMPANRFNGFTDLGIGIGLRVPHYKHILEKKPTVDWFEVISENYMVDAGRPLEILDKIMEQYQVVQHGVSMYFGSTDRLNRDHLKRLKQLVRRTNTHLSCLITFAGAALTAITHTICCRCPTRLLPRKILLKESGRCRISLKCR